MINFASLFSQFRGGSSSPINDLIDQPDTDLDRLLNEDSFVNEYKSGNSKVMSYMKYEKMQSLVNYVTVVGPAQDKNKGYKFPLAACDILSSDNSSTIDFFLPNGPLFVEENVQEQIEVEEQQQIEDEAPKQNEQPENAPKTVIEDQLENEGQGQQQQQPVQKENKETKDEQQKMDIEEPIEIKKKTRLVKIKKTITKVNKKEVEPLMNQLLSYFEGQVNYTLAGYVSKILISFFTKKPVQTMSHILLQPKHFDNILNHIQSRSVGQFILKIMTHQSTEILPQRQQAIQKMLSKLSKNQEIYIISNLSICMSQIIEKVAANAKSASPIPEFCALYFAPKIVISIINNVISSEENVSVYNSSILLTYLTNAPIILPENQTMVNQFKTLLSSFVQKSLEKLKITKDDRSTVGFGRVKIVEILSFIIRENILTAREIVARQPNFFPTFINLIKNYQMNNIIHNEFIKIITITLGQSQQSPLLNNLLEGEVLLNFLKEQSEEDQKIRAGSGKQKNRKGYIGHVISICRKIQEHSQKNSKLATFAENPEFENIVQNLVNKQIYEYNKNLAGFALRKGQPQTIMFMKEEVIKEHIKFLTATPPPIYQPEPENINIEHPDLEETHSIDVNEVLKESDKKRQIKQIEDILDEEVSPKYWISHINYEVDSLINDL